MNRIDRAIAYRQRIAARDLHQALNQVAAATFWLTHPDAGQPVTERQDLAEQCIRYAIEAGATANMLEAARLRGKETDPQQRHTFGDTFLTWTKTVNLRSHRTSKPVLGVRVRLCGDSRYRRVAVHADPPAQWLSNNGFQLVRRRVIEHRDLTTTIVTDWFRDTPDGTDTAQTFERGVQDDKPPVKLSSR